MPAGWPAWWEWTLELSGHVQARMEERGFNELDLRSMLEHAQLLIPDRVAGRWAVSSRHSGKRWLVIVEPDEARRRLIVITAFRR